MISINTITTNPFREQTYILHDHTNKCVIIDPGFYTQREKKSIIDFLENQQLQLEAVYYTHLHVDHIIGTQFILEKYKVPTYANKLDLPLLKANRALAISCAMDYPDYNYSIDFDVNDGDVLTFGESELKALHVPGHSPGSIVYYSQDDAFCIAGDVLFRGSVGRCDFLGGDGNLLIDSINRKLMVLPDDVSVFPGHGYATTIGDEKTYNPFLRM